MYIRMKTSKKAKYPTMQIVEGIREGKKVRQRTIAHLGVIKDKSDLERLKNLANNLIQKLEKEGLETDPRVELSMLKHQKTIYDGFPTVINRLMNLTSLDKIVESAQGKRKFNLNEVIKLVLVQRFAFPSSKLRTYERQNDYGFQGIEVEEIYRAMDAISPFDELIQKQFFDVACQTSGGIVDCLFFDVTTLYFESITQDDLRDFGFSKDQKHHSVQIVLALVVNSQGLPLAYETFKGNLAETKTLIPVLEKLRTRFNIENITVVCDRGLASQNNVVALQKAKFHFVIASKLKSMSKKLNINDLSQFKEFPWQKDNAKEDQTLVRTMIHPQYTDTQLIVTYSPRRAEKDRKDRERLIEKLRSKIGDAPNETAIKKVISNSGYKRYTTVKEGSIITINEKALQADAEWDGFHGIAVSNSAKLAVEEALARYKELWRIEEAFRVAKCTLKTRPIFHWAPHRIKSHVLLCFINLFFERFLELLILQKGSALTPDTIRYALAEIQTTLFKEESTNRLGKMQSQFTEDAAIIFQALDLPTVRGTFFYNECCA